MTDEQLKLGELLRRTIVSTKAGLNQLTTLRDEKQERLEKRGSLKDNELDDGVYTLYIGENSDLSGCAAHLERYSGNMELLNVMIKTLENQLGEFKEQFENL